jgi:hypothetical protein
MGCCTYGVPIATGAPIIAGAAVVVPQSDPRRSQLRHGPQQPELAVVTSASASTIHTFVLIKVSSGAPVAGVGGEGRLRTSFWSGRDDLGSHATKLASVIEGPLRPAQTKNQLRIVKASQLYITPDDVQTQHENFLQHFSGALVEKMLRLFSERSTALDADSAWSAGGRSDTMECVVQVTFSCGAASRK